jgi:hypothetical protein
VTSRTACNIRDLTPGTLTATDTCIGYHVTRFEASRKVILHTRYVSTCVRAGCGWGRGRETKKTKTIRCGAYYYSIVLNAHRVTSMADTDIDAVKYMSHVKKNNRYALQNNTCFMYKSSLRHIHDPVLSSLKMKGIRLLFSLNLGQAPSAHGRGEMQRLFVEKYKVKILFLERSVFTLGYNIKLDIK